MLETAGSKKATAVRKSPHPKNLSNRPHSPPLRADVSVQAGL